MSLAGWLLLILSWGVVTALVAFCFYKIFTTE